MLEGGTISVAATCDFLELIAEVSTYMARLAVSPWLKPIEMQHEIDSLPPLLIESTTFKWSSIRTLISYVSVKIKQQEMLAAFLCISRCCTLNPWIKMFMSSCHLDLQYRKGVGINSCQCESEALYITDLWCSPGCNLYLLGSRQIKRRRWLWKINLR